jgi:hypothetical protein
MDELEEAARQIAEACYIDQMRSDAAYHKAREIRGILLKFKGTIVDKHATKNRNLETKNRDLERRLYIAEAAVANSKL